MRRPRSVAVATVVLTALVAGGCALGRTDPPHGTEVSWSQVKRSGWGSAAYALTLGSNADALRPTGFLALIDAAGHTRFLRTGAGDNAGVASDGTTLCAATDRTTYRITASSARRSARGEGGQSTALTTVLPSGGCSFVFNSGGRADVYVQDTDLTSHTVVPVSPLVTGVDDSAAWISDGGDSSGSWALDRVDLRRAAVTRAATWRTDLPDHRAPGAVDAFVSAVGGRLFSVGGRLHLLEEVTYAKQGTDTIVEIEPGMRSQLRLGQIDPSTGTLESHFLMNTPHGLQTDAKGTSRPAVVACGDWLDGNRIITCDVDGRVLAVDVRTRKVQQVATLSAAALRARDAVATYRSGRLTMFLLGADGLSMETYDLAAGRRTGRTAVDGVGELVEDGQLMWSAAQLGDVP